MNPPEVTQLALPGLLALEQAEDGGAQVELPPRIRGLSPLFPHNGPGRMPHLEALIEGLAAAARAWPERARRRGVPEQDRESA